MATLAIDSKTRSKDLITMNNDRQDKEENKISKLSFPTNIFNTAVTKPLYNIYLTAKIMIKASHTNPKIKLSSTKLSLMQTAE